MDRLAELAARWGVDSDYVDAHGRPTTVPPEALSRIISALAESHAPASRDRSATFIVRQNRDHRLGLPPKLADTASAWMVLDEERVIARGPVEHGAIQLPHDLPVGSYRLLLGSKANAEQNGHAALLLVAPERTYQCEQPGHERLWVIAVQLYGLRSKSNWGHGDFTDLARLIDLCAKVGAAGVALNPIHALFDDRPEQTSPYAPNSRLFFNANYIDVEAIPEFPGLESAGLLEEVERLRRQDEVDYGGVSAAKAKGLRLAYERFRTDATPERRAALDAYRAERGTALERFAAFELLRRRYPQVWWDWPESWRRPSSEDLAQLRRQHAAELEFFEFVQWTAETQLHACQARAQRGGLPIGLYLDVAVGVDAGGADAWSEPEAVLSSLSVGAPPDVLNTAGQNWGLAGFNPAGLEAHRFEPFRAMLQALMRHAGAIRIDHVLGLKRLFLIPHGMSPREGAYVRLPFEALLAVIAQESVRFRCIVIGEDLGTVPENFRETMADWGLWSYLVMLFERGWDGSFHPPERFGRSALVTFTTHDLPTFAGWVSGHDLRVKRSIGIDPGESDEDRGRAHAAIRNALGLGWDAPIGFDAVARYLARTPTRLLVVSMEDLLGLVDQPNVPGTVDEHPNWRRRLPVSLDDLFRHEFLRTVAQAIAAEGRGTQSPQGTAHGQA